MQFQCPKCSGVVSIDESNLGKTVSCGHCHEIVNAPKNRFESGVIINDFIIEKEAGIGGMGVVYLARQITLDRPVALKILKEKYASDTEFIVQFVREARSAAKLNHPNIVQAYAVGEENGIFFFAMEYVDGDTMKEVLAQKKKIEQLTAAKIIRDIANALDYAWTESKIVHHDIKPDNIMLSKSGKAKLADLGLASMFGDSEIDDDGDEVLGTPQYISPEQLLGNPTDIRSDIYSLGATLYHLVTGQFPYTGKTSTEIAHQHVNGTLIPPKEKAPELSSAMNDIIVKMMAKDINQRYQSAAELAKDLQKYIDAPDAQPPASSGPAKVVSSPSGAPRLSFGKGGQFPPAPGKTAASAPANTAAENAVSSASKPVLRPSGAKPSSTPKVDLSGASKSIPKVNVNKPTVPKIGAASTNVPKIGVASTNVPKIGVASTNVPKIGAASTNVPKLNASAPADDKKAAAPPAAPQLGLKKEENTPPPAEKPAEKPAETPGSETAAAKEPKEKKAKQKKEDTAKSKKKKQPANQPKSYAWLIILLILLLGGAGGVTFYLYKNNWKAPIWEKFVAWNQARKAAAKKVVYRVPAPPKKEPTIQELRKDYIPEIEKLKKFIASNPSKGTEFIEKVDAFIFQKGRPELENEKAPFRELMDLRHEYDEKAWIAPARNRAAAAHQREINARIKAEKDRKAAEARMVAERKAAEARRIALQQEEARRKRQLEEAKRQEREKVQEYRNKIAPVYGVLAKMFHEAVKSYEKKAEFNRKIENLFNEYKPEGIQMNEYTLLENYAKRLKAELPRAQNMYDFITGNQKRFIGHILVIPRYGQVEIIDFNFPQHSLRVKSIISQKESKLSLKNERVRDRVFDAFIKKMPNVKDIKHLPFFYHLYLGNVSAARSLPKPSAFWNEFFKYYR